MLLKFALWLVKKFNNSEALVQFNYHYPPEASKTLTPYSAWIPCDYGYVQCVLKSNNVDNFRVIVYEL